ncbi:hypothetical protein HMPREF9141_2276 [Prevotella multiformis DSM 16608]|uniref:Uncharacterized protein n=1 Tax=Prevotella multiformis DSM 16608 TaxID=888743 RepID=F0F9K9_9BACT|nr:hypothetical protein HMPREF9141_2276 [Prevotella multiformis DSM 16608]
MRQIGKGTATDEEQFRLPVRQVGRMGATDGEELCCFVEIS